MKIRLRLHFLVCVPIVLSAFLELATAQKARASSEDSLRTATASTAKPGAAQAAPDLTADTVLLKFPLDATQPPADITLKKLMDVFKVPGLSVAVIDNYQVAWARGFGMTESGGSTPVTPKTLFQAGSISKPVAAVGAMWLVEHGRLSLDEDVNKKLKTWTVPENEFTKDQKVTLRRRARLPRLRGE